MSLQAHIALTLLRGLTQAQCVELLRRVDEPQCLFDDTVAVLDSLDELAPTARPRLQRLFAEHGEEALRRAADELDFCHRHSIRPLALGTADYPHRLAQCPDAPAVLYYRGTADLDARHVVAVVGTRRITPYGKAHCERFCAELAAALPDALVVSGLAGNFVRRNRIVAGLADVTLVVESAEKGGALITAHLAADYNRTVCAFPGRTDDEFSRGCLHLIRDRRAELITDAADLMGLMNWETKNETPTVQLELFDGDSPEQSSLIRALRAAGSEGETAERLCIITNLPLSQVNAALFDLQMSSAVTLLAGGRYRLRIKPR